MTGLEEAAVGDSVTIEEDVDASPAAAELTCVDESAVMTAAEEDADAVSTTAAAAVDAVAVDLRVFPPSLAASIGGATADADTPFC